MGFKEVALTQSVALPHPVDHAFFPNREPNIALSNEVLYRAGEKNLVYALGYGSHVTGDVSPTSMRDVMIVVEDVKQFHTDNLLLHKADYGKPRVAQWHALLNTLGFNFYHTHFRGEDDQILSAKFAVISQEDFIKGCSGTFVHKDDDRQGAFGLYVAGRVQKAPPVSPI